ncbi:trehalose-phosphatase [Candidatus Omnitrophota bacterium]
MKNNYSFDAVIFDLDGVITQTAGVHAAAWKATFDGYLRLREERDKLTFREFTHDADYLPFVDGKPRYKGVKSFLESRKISIPYGDPSDAPDQETVCGLGNKKNALFVQLLSHGAEVFPSTMELIKVLKDAGIRIGVASSSKNCQLILKSCGIEHYFETRVDGVVSVELGLKGKPEGDIFMTAARNLGARPARSVVVEDATSGVQAGRNGQFGFVLGVARKDNHDELINNGADIVVSDLEEIDIEKIESWFHRQPKPLLANWQTAKSVLLNGRQPVLFLDYDGTLTPIVQRPELAVLAEPMRAMLKQLAKKYTLAIVSGRTREDVQNLVKLDNIYYAGSHGFDICGPSLSMIQPQAEQAQPKISAIKEDLDKKLRAISGLFIEEKKFSLALHYRLVKQESDLVKIKQEADKIIQQDQTLRLISGKKVYEILPDIDWDKGQAIRWLMQGLKISWPESSVIYIGDDTTDEDAFRAVRTRGTAILVADQPKESAADFRLSSPEEVRELFEKIIQS